MEKERDVVRVERSFHVNRAAAGERPMRLRELSLAEAHEASVNVASDIHRMKMATLDLDRPRKASEAFSGMGTYAKSKLANVMFTYALARRLTGQDVTVNSLHPGGVASGFGRDMNGLVKLVFKVVRPFLITPERGAETSIYLASSPEVQGISGRYFAKSKAVPSSRASLDEALQERLWNVTLQQLKLTDSAVLAAAAA